MNSLSIETVFLTIMELPLAVESLIQLVTPTSTRKVMVLLVQHVIVIPLVQVVYNVLIQQDNAPAMLVTRVPIVMLLVVVMALDQVVHLVMLQQVNVLAILDIPVPPVVPVLPITIKMAVLAKVSLFE